MDQRPNILIFLTDQQRWDTCGCYGDNPLPLTPNLDRMAARGTLCRNSFTVQPVCAPARGSLQTGSYATRHGVWRNGIALPTSRRTLAHHLGDAGYETAYIGKWHLACQEPVPPELRGGYRDHWLAADLLEFTSHPYDLRLYDAAGQLVTRPGYRVDALTDFALDFLHERPGSRDRPFFLCLSFLEPHQQNDLNRSVAPDGYADRYRDNITIPPDLDGLPGDYREQLPDYYGACASLDENLGRVLRALEETGHDRDTVLLFCSDHGSHFRTRNSEYKRSCHDACVRVPTVLQGPGFDRGAVVNELVCTIDWTATLLDAAGVKPGADVAGRSIRPRLDGAAPDWPDEVLIRISETQVGRAIRTRRWKYAVTAPALDGLQHSGAPAYVEQFVYDLETDPAERTNLAGRPEIRAVANELAATLRRRMVAAGEPAPDILPASA